MAKQRKDWQKMGFRSYQEYQQAVKKANINRIFKECLQEADDAHQATKRTETAKFRTHATEKSITTFDYRNLRNVSNHLQLRLL